MSKLSSEEIYKIANKGHLEGDFLVKQANIGGNTDKQWISLNISNGEQEFTCKKWNFIEGEFVPEAGSVIYLTGSRDDYKGNFTIIANHIIPSELSPLEFTQSGPCSLSELQNILDDYLDKVTNPIYRAIIDAVKAEYGKIMKSCPAAVGHHHAYNSGWYQHTAEVIILASRIADSMYILEKYPIDIEEVHTGAFVHDLGKLKSYGMKNGVTAECNEMEGSLGHIVIGLQMLEELRLKYFSDVPYDNEYYQRIIHDVAAHHENLEWGSPTKPNSLEALIIARADNLSASICSMIDELKTQQDSWGVTRSRKFGTYLHKKINK